MSQRQVPCTDSRRTVAHPGRCELGTGPGRAIAGTVPCNEQHPPLGDTCRVHPGTREWETGPGRAIAAGTVPCNEEHPAHLGSSTCRVPAADDTQGGLPDHACSWD